MFLCQLLLCLLAITLVQKWSSRYSNVDKSKIQSCYMWQYNLIDGVLFELPYIEDTAISNKKSNAAPVLCWSVAQLSSTGGSSVVVQVASGGGVVGLHLTSTSYPARSRLAPR